MRHGWLIVGVLAFGCHDTSDDIKKFADRICACTDKDCAEQVVDELVAFAKSHKSARGNEERAKKEGERFGMCAVQAGVDKDSFIQKMQSLGE